MTNKFFSTISCKDEDTLSSHSQMRMLNPNGRGVGGGVGGGGGGGGSLDSDYVLGRKQINKGPFFATVARNYFLRPNP